MTAKSEVEKIIDKVVSNLLHNTRPNSSVEAAMEQYEKDKHIAENEINQLITSSLTSERERIVEMFLRRLTNDHNEKLRWLRGIAFDEDEIIRTIVDLILTGGKP